MGGGFEFMKCGSMLVRRKNKKFCRGVLQCGVGYGIICGVAKRDMKCWVIDWLRTSARGRRGRVWAVLYFLVPPPPLIVKTR